MRPLEDAQADWDAIKEVQVNMISAYPEVRRLWCDIPDLLAEIERLKADLAQSRSAITKLSREIWKVC